jgi:hypothetical protein
MEPPAQQWELVLGRPELAELVLEAVRSGDDEEEATQAAHDLCLASRACRQAVLCAVQHAAAPARWAREPALGAMAALASLRLSAGDKGAPGAVDPAQLPPLPRLSRLDLLCSLAEGAEGAAEWPRLAGLRGLGLTLAAGGPLPPAVLRLPHLKRLTARGGAPQPIQQLTGLRALELYRCSFNAWQLDLQRLSSLTSLMVRNHIVKYLPDGLSRLPQLRSLHLRCRGLTQLPDSLGGLAALTSLDLTRCSGLAQLPESLGQLSALASLDLSGCSGLERLPASLRQLSALTRLDLRECSGLVEELGDSQGHLSTLG